MIFPRVKNPNPASGAWWQAPAPSKNAKGNLVLIALLAGSLGGFLGSQCHWRFPVSRS